MSNSGPSQAFNGLEVRPKNSITSYWPLRNKDNDFFWDDVAGLVLTAILGESIDLSLEDFEEACKKRFLEIGDEKLWLVISEAYFRNADLLRLHPRFTLLKPCSSHSKVTAANLRLGEVFSELLQGYHCTIGDEGTHNFVEIELYRQIGGTKKATVTPAPPYLPFLAQVFEKDIAFLCGRPAFMMTELANVLKFYALSYCAQVALNLIAWKELPAAKPLFFILADEKANSERAQVKRYGYKHLSESMIRVFPWLSMSQQLQMAQPRPLWQFFQEAILRESLTDVVDLFSFAKKFASNRGLPIQDERPDSLSSAFDLVFDLAELQFTDGIVNNSGRPGTNRKFVAAFEKQISAEFAQLRGRAGRVLVINQEQVLLLTNLIVGQRERLWFTELIQGFQDRGVFFDRQTESALIAFYERVGNVERKSDSGEAIYVRKTI